jgi:transcriptional regulator with XRE-family HTH domain
MHGETRRDVREVVGARIMWFRVARCLSVRQLSDLSDIPELMLATIERGRTRITFENLLCLARALGVRVTAFFDDDDAKGPAPLDTGPEGAGR